MFLCGDLRCSVKPQVAFIELTISNCVLRSQIFVVQNFKKLYPHVLLLHVLLALVRLFSRFHSHTSCVDTQVFLHLHASFSYACTEFSAFYFMYSAFPRFTKHSFNECAHKVTENNVQSPMLVECRLHNKISKDAVSFSIICKDCPSHQKVNKGDQGILKACSTIVFSSTKRLSKRKAKC